MEKANAECIITYYPSVIPSGRHASSRTRSVRTSSVSEIEPRANAGKAKPALENVARRMINRQMCMRESQLASSGIVIPDGPHETR